MLPHYEMPGVTNPVALQEGIDSFVRSTLGEPAEEVENISRIALKNQVYRVSTQQGQFVVKLYQGRYPDRRMAREIEGFAVTKGQEFVKGELRADFSRAHVPFPILVRPYLQGSSLKDNLRSRSTDDGILDSFYQALLAMTSLHTPHFHPFSPPTSCQGIFYDIFQTDNDTIGHVLGSFPCIPAYFDKRTMLRDDHPTFCNGDLGSNDIIFTTEGIEIIDWENCCVGDPSRDCGYLTYSAAGVHFGNTGLVEKIIELSQSFQYPNLNFYIAERVIGSAVVEYVPEGNSAKLGFAMDLAHRMLNN